MSGIFTAVAQAAGVVASTVGRGASALGRGIAAGVGLSVDWVREEIQFYYDQTWVRVRLDDDFKDQQWRLKHIPGAIPGLIFGVGVGSLVVLIKNGGATGGYIIQNAANALFNPEPKYFTDSLNPQSRVAGGFGYAVGLVVSGLMFPFSVLWNAGIQAIGGLIRGWKLSENLENNEESKTQLMVPRAKSITDFFQKFVLGSPGQVLGLALMIPGMLASGLVRSIANAVQPFQKAFMKIWNGTVSNNYQGDEPKQYSSQDPNPVYRGLGVALGATFGFLLSAISIAPVGVVRTVSNIFKSIANAALLGWNSAVSNDKDKDGKSIFKAAYISTDNKFYKYLGRALSLPISIPMALIAAVGVTLGRIANQTRKAFFSSVTQIWNAVVKFGRPQRSDGQAHSKSKADPLLGSYRNYPVKDRVFSWGGKGSEDKKIFNPLVHGLGMVLGFLLSIPAAFIAAPAAVLVRSAHNFGRSFGNVFTNSIFLALAKDNKNESEKPGLPGLNGYLPASILGGVMGGVAGIVVAGAVAAARVLMHVGRGFAGSFARFHNFAMGEGFAVASDDISEPSKKSGPGYAAFFGVGQVLALPAAAAWVLTVSAVRSIKSIVLGVLYTAGELIKQTLSPERKWERTTRPDDNNHQYLGYGLGVIIGVPLGLVFGLISATVQSFSATFGAAWNAAFSVKEFDTLRQDARSGPAKFAGVLGYVAAAPIMAVAVAVRVVRRVPDVLAAALSIAVSPLVLAWKGISRLRSTPKTKVSSVVHSPLRALRHSVDAFGQLKKDQLITGKSSGWARFKRQTVKVFTGNQDSLIEKTLKAYEKDFDAWRTQNPKQDGSVFLNIQEVGDSEVAKVRQKIRDQSLTRNSEIERQVQQIDNTLQLAKEYLREKFTKASETETREEVPSAQGAAALQLFVPDKTTQSSDAASNLTNPLLPTHSQPRNPSGRLNQEVMPESATTFFKVFVGEKVVPTAAVTSGSGSTPSPAVTAVSQ